MSHYAFIKRAQILGNKVEMDIANTIAQNAKILRVGIHFNTLGPRAKVQESLKRNWDKRIFKKILKLLYVVYLTNISILFKVRLSRIGADKSEGEDK